MEHVIDRVNTVSKWGERPSERSLEGAIPRSLVVIDKPEGPTSHQVSAWVKRLFDRKAGHSGTLDPNVTGVLPMGIGHSVRLLDLLHSVPKEYVAAMKFHGNVNKKEVAEILDEFEGEIIQKPPVRSGVKRERRTRKIYDLEILDSRGEEYLLRIKCESGTYIMTLCKDLGKTLGTGGHMMELRRTEAGNFKEKESVILQDLRDAYEFYKEGKEEMLNGLLLPYERALEIFQKVKVKDTAAGAVLNGADLAFPGILEMDDFSAGGNVAVMSAKGEGLAVGESLYDAEEIMKMEEGLVVQTDRVFSPTGDYPTRWK